MEKWNPQKQSQAHKKVKYSSGDEYLPTAWDKGPLQASLEYYYYYFGLNRHFFLSAKTQTITALEHKEAHISPNYRFFKLRSQLFEFLWWRVFQLLLKFLSFQCQLYLYLDVHCRDELTVSRWFREHFGSTFVTTLLLKAHFLGMTFISLLWWQFRGKYAPSVHNFDNVLSINFTNHKLLVRSLF